MAVTMKTHHTQVRWASGLNLLVGVWLFASAFAVAGRGPMVTNNVLCGIGAAALAATRALGAHDLGGLSWVNALLGAWVVVSPWAVMGAPGPAGPSSAVVINNCITGAAVFLLSCWSAVATGTERDTPSMGTTRHPYGA